MLAYVINMELTKELETVELDSPQWACLHYLELEVENDPNLKEAVTKFPKGVKEIFEYVVAMAQKNQKNRCFFDSGKRVFEWVKEYVVDYEAIDKDRNNKPVIENPPKFDKPVKEKVETKPKETKAKDTGYIEEGQMSLFDLLD